MIRFASFLMACILLGGCAANRGIVDVEVNPAPAPDSTNYVKIIEVIDSRKFEREPGDPSTPSLKYGEIHNENITSRAIARKRNGYGMAMGDILLPEGNTVSGLVRDALTNALRNSGYVVVKEGHPNFDEAVPVRAVIQKFWSWFNPGFWSVELEFQALVHLDGDLGGLDELTVVTGQASHETSFADDSAWRTVFSKGIDNLITNLARAIEDEPQAEPTN